MVKTEDITRLAAATGRLLTTRARVKSATMVSASMREITLAAAEFASWDCEPGCCVRLALGTFGVNTQRSYSVWRHDPGTDLLVLRAHLAADGPGTRWAASACPGDSVFLRGPRRRLTVDHSARWHLFAGDETGAVPLLRMRGSLPGGAGAFGVLEATDTAHRVPATGTSALQWVDRGTASAVASAVLLGAVRDLRLPAGPGVAYLAGERDTCLALRRHLVLERGMPRRSVRVSLHWAAGKRGLE